MNLIEEILNPFSISLMNFLWFILALFIQTMLSLITIFILKKKYGFSLEIGSTMGMQVTRNEGLDWDDKKIKFFEEVYFFCRFGIKVIFILEIGAFVAINDHSEFFHKLLALL
ncbi:hypothetical protein [Exiguobacterium acetylicum]|uniref:Uncharacterized protein n=1 Tax=Exiguobacterium acetylicum TaxID=41170 RepID=A0ABX8GE89_EXIAC|nr:hypothetical protein [Exiguobacterium acetylicum]QWB31969.1 hypothetical protein KKI46_17570 [Exiguobacterium acetylicum]